MTENHTPLQDLYARAEELQKANRPHDLAAVCSEILKLDAGSVPALQFLAAWNMDQGQHNEALRYLRPYCKAVPNQEVMMLPLALALEETGALEEAKKTLQRALKLNENNFLTYSYLGSVLEKLNKTQEAAWAYSFGVDVNPKLKVLPKQGGYPKAVLERITRSNAHLKAVGRKLHLEAVEKVKSKFPNGDFSRIERAVWRKLHDEWVGLKSPDQQPMVFYIPDLPSSPWYDSSQFSWAEDLEKECVPIRNEVLQNLRVDVDTKPYLQPGGHDAAYWGQMLGSQDWSALHLFDGMRKKEAVCQRFSYTTGVLDKLPLFRIGGTLVEALFSVLKPRTKIPPHFGNSNARLTVHLPLVVPEGCKLIVGKEARNVVAGKTMIFDDTFFHAARNDSGETRIVLILEAWNPHLREEERAVVEETYLSYESWMQSRDHSALLNG